MHSLVYFVTHNPQVFVLWILDFPQDFICTQKINIFVTESRKQFYEVRKWNFNEIGKAYQLIFITRCLSFQKTYLVGIL